MKRRIREILAVAVVWAVAVPVGAQTPEALPTPVVLTLSDCIQKALANSPGMEAAEFEREVVEGKLGEAKSAYFLPEIKFRALGGPVPDLPNGSGPPNFPNVDTQLSELGPFFQLRIEAVQPLFTFGKLSNLKEAARHGVQAKKDQERVVRNELIRKTKGVYLGLSYLYSLKEFLLELQDRSQKARERVIDQLKHRSADVTSIDQMRLDVFQGETGRRLSELNGGIDLGLSALRILTGIPSTTPIDIADRMIRFRNVELKPVDYYLDRARTSRPEVHQLTEAVAIKRSILNSQKAEFLPTFFLGGFYGYGIAPGRQKVDNPFLVDSFNYSSGGLAFGLEQKLGFHLTSSRTDQARADYHATLAQQRLAMQGIELQIRKAYSDVVSKREGVKSGENAFKAGRSWVMATTLNFGVGLVPVKDLLEAFVAYSKVKAGYYDVIHDYLAAVADLSRALGEEVTDLAY
ncbi:MAG: TolC family protein [Pseudomonadota bacterium]